MKSNVIMIFQNYPQCCKHIPLLRRCIGTYKTNCQILMDHFGFSMSRASNFLRKLRLDRKESDVLLASINYCKSLGYTNEAIFRTPKIVARNPLVLEQHHMLMEEGGFQNISPNVLARALHYIRSDISKLKKLNLIPKGTDVADTFIKHINPLPSNFNPNLKSTHFHALHFSILCEYLRRRLNASDEDLSNLFKIHRMLKYKSFRIVQENISLAEELELSPAKILKHGYLLHNFPRYTRIVLTDLCNLAGADMKQAMKLYPKLMMTSPKNFIKIYGILKEFDIPDDTIQRQMNIFTLSPETVRSRLEEIKRVPELRVLFRNKDILSLVINHNRATSRLTFMQQLQFNCTSLRLLGAYNGFEDHIQEGKDIYHFSDVSQYISNLLGIDKKLFKKALKKHPFACHVPFLEIEKTFLYLRHQGYSVIDILQVIHILLYPISKVDKAVQEMKKDKTLPKNVSKVNKLNFIYYTIEKDFHFTGNGIWTNLDPIKEEPPQRELA